MITQYYITRYIYIQLIYHKKIDVMVSAHVTRVYCICSGSNPSQRAKKESHWYNGRILGSRLLVLLLQFTEL